MADLWPYSQRLGGTVADLEHEALWRGATDYVLPGQVTSALGVGISGSTWTVQPGQIHITGHVLDIDTVASGALPGGSTSTRRTVIAAFIDRTKSPWVYGIHAVSGTPGGGRPALSTSRTGLYEVPLRAFDTATNGATTLLTDERPSASGVSPWVNLSLAAEFITFDTTPQARLTFDGKRAEFRGTIRRADSTLIDGTEGPTLLTVPEAYRPANTLQRFSGQTSVGAGTPSGGCRIDVSGSGGLRLWTEERPVYVGIFGGIWLD